MKDLIVCYVTRSKNSRAPFELRFFRWGFVFCWRSISDLYFEVMPK